MGTAKLTAGARALRAYLESKKLSITAFCSANSLDRIQVARAMKGERERMSVDFAYAIERATRGRVPCSLWRSSTAKAA